MCKSILGQYRTPNYQFSRIAKWTLIRQHIILGSSGNYPKRFGEKAEFQIINFGILQSGQLTNKSYNQIIVFLIAQLILGHKTKLTLIRFVYVKTSKKLVSRRERKNCSLL